MNRLRLLALSAAFVLAAFSSAETQNSNERPKNLRVPDISTIPGAVTKAAGEFDLAETNFLMRNEYWMAIDVDKATEATLQLDPRMPGGKYTFVLEVPHETGGDSTYWIEVGDEKLPEKTIPERARKRTPGHFPKIMWTEIPYKIGTPVTIGAKAAVEDGKPVTYGYWSRLIMIPHRNQGQMVPGPPGARPPMPPAQAGGSPKTEQPN